MEAPFATSDTLTPEKLELARAAAEEYSFEVRSGIALTGGRVNETWRIETDQGPRVLRTYPKTRQHKQIRFEAQILQSLHAEPDVRVPAPVARHPSHRALPGAREFVSIHRGGPLMGRAFLWLEALPGRALSRHEATQLSPPKLAAFLRPIFSGLQKCVPPFRAVAETRTFATRFSALLAQLKREKRGPDALLLQGTFDRLVAWEANVSLPTQVIHSDLHPGNILADEAGQLALVDFDDAHVGLRAADWVLASLEFSWSKGHINEARYASLLTALAPPDATDTEWKATSTVRAMLLLKAASTAASLGIEPRCNPYFDLALDSRREIRSD